MIKRERRGRISALLKFAGLLLALVCAKAAFAQTWTWTTETIDSSGGIGTSLAVDGEGNLHMSYSGGKGWMYGFRPASESRWYTMALGGPAEYTSLRLDESGHAHTCSIQAFKAVRYAYYDGKKWNIQDVGLDTEGARASCAVAASQDGKRHLTWYRMADGGGYLHLRYAVLKDGAWVVRTFDSDMQTGKWHSMALDAQGNPYISYDAFVRGVLKCAHWNGKTWDVRIVDSRSERDESYNVGMGSSLALDAKGDVHISYYTDHALRYARRQGSAWKIETVDVVAASQMSAVEYRSFVALDKDGFPHITYEDLGILKHAFWDGQKWRLQVLAVSGPTRFRHSSMAISPSGNTVYVSFRDPVDGSLVLAIGRRVETPRTALGKSPEDEK